MYLEVAINQWFEGYVRGKTIFSSPYEWVTQMKACILVKTDVGAHTNVAKQIARLRGVKSAFSVMGRTDVVAQVESKDLRALTQLGLKIAAVKGVNATETLIGWEE